MSVILVIEDTEILLEDVMKMLDYAGYEVLGALDALEGMTLAQRHAPDLILSDIMMPGMSGFDFLKQIRNDPAFMPIPVIIMTAKSEREAQRYCMEIGADDFLTKPFTHQELLGAVKARLTRKKDVLTWSQRDVEKARRRLVDLVAHELRTPLVSITATQEMIQMQLDELPKDQLIEMLEMMESGSQRLHHLVEQMVLLTQLESNTMNQEYLARYGMISTYRYLIDSAHSRAERFTYRKTNVGVDVDPLEDAISVRCDPTALGHALSEIIVNAILFSPQDERVRVLNRVVDGRVEILVVDEGPGIPQRHLSRVSHELFYQIDREKQEQQGVGLGLALARRVIELHDGSLQLFSDASRGTRVLVQLPCFDA